MSNYLNRARFALAAPNLRNLPADEGAELAFAGRSNAGKSSALNALVGQRALARTSRTPGRTQQLVVFELDSNRRLIDLPGYGYAKVPLAVRAQWGELMERYLRERRSLRTLVLVTDVRHALTPGDQKLLTLCASLALPCHILLTKADKLSRGAGAKALATVRREVAANGWQADTQLFSSLKKTGVDEARTALTHLLETYTPSI